MTSPEPISTPHAIDQLDPRSIIVTRGGESLPQIIKRAIFDGRTSVFDYLAWLEVNPTIGEGRDPRAALPRGLSVHVPREESPAPPTPAPQEG